MNTTTSAVDDVAKTVKNGDVVGNIGKNTITYQKLADSDSFSLALKD
jgi:hypothetical protein